jgi:hypothetical protein
MQQDKFGQMIFSEADLCDQLMQDPATKLIGVVVDTPGILERAAQYLSSFPAFLTWTFPEDQDCSIPKFDQAQQDNWHMPDEYKTMDIAAHILSLCKSEAELQRCGQELLLYQERDLFELLKFLRYLVDLMREHRLIWGVGRGSSTASFVLYKLGIHKIDALHYNLDIAEFLR